MSVNNDVIAKLEALEWDVNHYIESANKERELYEIHQYSPAGEDLYFTLEGSTVDEITKSAQSLRDNFDEEEHVSGWLEAKRSKVSGVPDLMSLVEDAKAIKEMLNDICCTLVNEQPVVPLRERAKELLNDDAFCNAFYKVFRRAIKTEGEKPKRIARDIIRTFVNQDDCDEMLVSTTGYCFQNLVYLAEQEMESKKNPSVLQK